MSPSLFVSSNTIFSALVALVGVVGPNSEVISFQERGGQVVIRQCARESLPTELESGCRLREGTAEVRLSERDFRNLAFEKIAALDQSKLSDSQRLMLERALGPDPQPAADSSELAQLNARLARNQAFKQAYPADYDAAEEKELGDRIDCLTSRQQGYEAIWQAKKEVGAVVAGLMSDMRAPDLTRTLAFSGDHDGLGYNLLRAFAEVDACKPEATGQALVGSLCRTSSGALWRIEKRTEEGHTVVKDLASGLLVSDVVADERSLAEARQLCTDRSSEDARGGLALARWRLPSAGPDSDFSTLDRDGYREIAWNATNKMFWSTSWDKDRNASVFYDARGYQSDMRANEGDTWKSMSVICVSSP